MTIKSFETKEEAETHKKRLLKLINPFPETRTQEGNELISYDGKLFACQDSKIIRKEMGFSEMPRYTA
jgi:hypothetical protein